MKSITRLMVTACGLVLPCLTFTCLTQKCLAHSDSNKWPLREQETIQKTLPLSGPPMRVVVDNVFGYVHVTGVAGSEVRITAHKSIRAESDSDLQQARSEIKLETTGNPGSVSVYYDAPWRCSGDHLGCHSDQRRFYEVAFDIDIEVPRNARIVISTVNGGDIQIQKTAGDFKIDNVNGGIAMSQVAGAGEVRTVNGPVSVRFDRNPSAPVSFATINGELDVYFQPALSADLSFKTMNGEVFTDFPVSARSGPAVQPETRDGKFVYRSNGFRAGRAGTGGPELSFNTLNGNIRIHENAKGNQTP